MSAAPPPSAPIARNTSSTIADEASRPRGAEVLVLGVATLGLSDCFGRTLSFGVRECVPAPARKNETVKMIPTAHTVAKGQALQALVPDATEAQATIAVSAAPMQTALTSIIAATRSPAGRRRRSKTPDASPRGT